MHRLLPIALVVFAATVSTPGAASAAARLHCTIVAGPRHVVVRGTARADVICATRGRHVVYAGRGKDTIYTGAGDDVIHAGPGNDTVHSGAGADRVFGGPGRDTIDGNNGGDRIEGGLGNDHLAGDAGNDALSGGPGADVLDGGPGENTCDGGLGADTLSKWCDRQAPVLRSLTVSETSIDTSAGDVEVTVTARITDDLSGLLDADLVAVSGTRQAASAQFDSSDRISGTALDGVYQATLYFHHYAPQGAMPLGVWLWDQVGDKRVMTTAELAARGLPSVIDQTGQGDSEGPQLRALSVSGATVDTSGGDATLSVRMHVTDDVSGLSSANVWWRSPDGSQTVEAYVGPNMGRVSGNATDGEYVVSITFPRGSAHGVWTIGGARLFDQAGNVTEDTPATVEGAADAGLTIDQTGVADTTPPLIQSIAITPDPIDDTDGQTLVWLSAHVTDDLAGVVQVECNFSSIHNRQQFSITAGPGFNPPMLDGTVTGGQWVAANWAIPGVWQGACHAKDAVGHVGPNVRESITFL
jgi:hypothetical protein